MATRTTNTRLLPARAFFLQGDADGLVRGNPPREYPRAPFFGKSSPTVLPADPVDAYAFDISLGGVGLNAQLPCPRGCMVRVSFFLKGPGGERVEHVLGRVAYVKADESGTRIGIEFQEPIQGIDPPGIDAPITEP